MSNMTVINPSTQEKAELGKLLRRQAKDGFMAVLVTVLTVLAVAILVTILAHVFINGVGALNWDFFTQLPKPHGETGGGIAHAIIGTLIMLILAGVIAVPIGVATAIYLSEYGRGRFASIVRFCLELLAELPSIVVGVFVWAVLAHRYSGFAGSAALIVIMLPIIAKSVEEILHLVPDSLRESALALGTPKWRVVFKVVVPTVLPGILTGIVLAMARAAGEAAPLLLTALGNQFFNFDFTSPMAAVPLQIYNYATTPYEDLHQQAWGATFILIALVAILSATVRLYTRSRKIETR